MPLTEQTQAALAAAAREAMTRAYAPYSGFFVGAALLATDGTVYAGCNIENAAFSPTICAERCAVAKAVSEGRRQFTAIAVCGGRNGVPIGYCTPCGVCRQVLREFADPAAFTVILAGKDGCVTRTLAALLPESFGSEILKTEEAAHADV